MKSIWCQTILFLSFAPTQLTGADTSPLFDTFSAGRNIFNPQFGWYNSTNNGIIRGSSFAWAFQIQTELSRVTQITMDIGRSEEVSANLSVAIHTDEGGQPSLLPIATTTPNPTHTLYLEHASVSYDFEQTAILEPGVIYWLIYAPAITDLYGEAHNADYLFGTSLYNPRTSRAVRIFTEQSLQWSDWSIQADQPYPLFRLDSTGVPEPSTWALLGLGSALFWFAARRCRKPSECVNPTHTSQSTPVAAFRS